MIALRHLLLPTLFIYAGNHINLTLTALIAISGQLPLELLATTPPTSSFPRYKNMKQL